MLMPQQMLLCAVDSIDVNCNKLTVQSHMTSQMYHLFPCGLGAENKTDTLAADLVACFAAPLHACAITLRTCVETSCELIEGPDC